MGERSEEYSKLAEDCLDLAVSAQTPELKIALEAMAERYLRLARQAEQPEPPGKKDET